MFLYFDLNSEVIEANTLSTQVTYDSNHTSLLHDSTKTNALNFFKSILLGPKRKRPYQKKNK